MANMVPADYLASIAAQLGIRVADKSAYEGIFVGPIQLDATLAAGAQIQGTTDTIAESGTAGMLRLDNAQPWRGIVLSVEATCGASDGAVPTPNTFADTDLWMKNSEVLIRGSGGELRVPVLRCGSIKPAITPDASSAGTGAFATTYSRTGRTRLLLPYWYDAISIKGFRWLNSVITIANMDVNVTVDGLWASAVQSRGNTPDNANGVRADASHICPPNVAFIRAVAAQIASGDRVAQQVVSFLQG